MDENQAKAVFKDEETQSMLNQPVQKSGGMGMEDLTFMNNVLALVDQGKIELYTPSSLINEAHYNTLSDEKKSKTDMEAMNLLNSIREMKDLKDANFAETYQMESLVNRIRLSKERLEEEGGDLFII